MYFLGVDVGSSKTLAVVFAETGQVLGLGRTGSGNFQTVGRKKAGENIKKSIQKALQNSNLNLEQIESSYLGISGADRSRDFSIIEGILRGIFPGEVFSFDNDAVLGLLAETGVKKGVCVVCGTGTNVIGFDEEGRRVQIGGLGFLFGDYGGGPFMTKLAIRRAIRGWEGRGPETILYDRLCRSFSVDRLIDLIDQIYEGYAPDYAARTPLVFEAALEGDQVARNIIEDVALDIAQSVKAALEKLTVDREFPVIALGGVFQKADPPLLFNSFKKNLNKIDPGCNISLLSSEPVLGAAAGALSEVGVKMTPEIRRKFRQSYRDLISKKKTESE